MPIYKPDEMEWKKDPESVAPAAMKAVVGELMKVGFVRYEQGIGPPPHFHPNEEQFILMVDGTLRILLGDEERDLVKGDLVHIPRNVRHTVRATNGTATFFTCKSPAGNGDLAQDYNKAADADTLTEKLDTWR
jgi:quercetin dioxygenase-like cupin family protein